MPNPSYQTATAGLYNDRDPAEVGDIIPINVATAWDTNTAAAQKFGAILGVMGSRQPTGPNPVWTIAAGLRVSEEVMTLSTTTTTGTSGILAANSYILAVLTRIISVGTGVTAFSVADAVTAARFSASAAAVTLGATRVCMDHHSPAAASAAAGPAQPAAGSVRIATTGTPGGTWQIAVQVVYVQFAPPPV